jgi:hypothetical protein
MEKIQIKIIWSSPTSWFLTQNWNPHFLIQTRHSFAQNCTVFAHKIVGKKWCIVQFSRTITLQKNAQLGIRHLLTNQNGIQQTTALNLCKKIAPFCTQNDTVFRLKTERICAENNTTSHPQQHCICDQATAFTHKIAPYLCTEQHPICARNSIVRQLFTHEKASFILNIL